MTDDELLEKMARYVCGFNELEWDGWDDGTRRVVKVSLRPWLPLVKAALVITDMKLCDGDCDLDEDGIGECAECHLSRILNEIVGEEKD